MTTKLPPEITGAWDDDDTALDLDGAQALTPMQEAEAWKRTAHISASKVLHGYCGNPECSAKRPEGLELSCGSIECARWMRTQPQIFYDHFLPVYNGALVLAGDDEDEDEDEDELPVEYGITRRMLALFGLATALGGGVVVAALFAVGARWLRW